MTPAAALVADAEDFFAVCIGLGRLTHYTHHAAGERNGDGRHTCDDDVVDVLGPAPLRQVVEDAVGVVDAEEAALGVAEEARVVLDGVALGGV